MQRYHQVGFIGARSGFMSVQIWDSLFGLEIIAFAVKKIIYLIIQMQPKIIRQIKSQTPVEKLEKEHFESQMEYEQPSIVTPRDESILANSISASIFQSNSKLLPPVIPQKKSKSKLVEQQIYDQQIKDLDDRLAKAVRRRIEEAQRLRQMEEQALVSDQEEQMDYYEPEVEVKVEDKVSKSEQVITKLNKSEIKKKGFSKTKQPSLPILTHVHKSGQYYNKWYIPYDQRYIKKQRASQLDIKTNPFAKDEKHFYNNLHNVEEWLSYDPFESKYPAQTMEFVVQSRRLESLKEMLKGNKVIHDYKKMLDATGSRVPVFIQQVVEEN